MPACLQAAGVKLKELIGDETVSFYVSPFVRSKETYTCIKEHFSEDQVYINMVPRTPPLVRIQHLSDI